MKNRSRALFWVFYALILLGLVFFSSCRFSSSVTKNPEFSVSHDSLCGILKEIANFENIEIRGTLFKSTGSPEKSELTVKVINPKDVTLSNDQAINRCCFQIALEISRHLKKPKEFDSYKVLFEVRRVENGITTSSYKGSAFKSSELSSKL